MTLPKAISDAIEAHQKAVSECQTIRYTKFGKECIGEARAALERAIEAYAVERVAEELQLWPSGAAGGGHDQPSRAAAQAQAAQGEVPMAARRQLGLRVEARNRFPSPLRHEEVEGDPMTQRLTDDRLQALRLMLHEHAASWLHTIDRDTLAAMLDEIEERRRNDPKVVCFFEGVPSFSLDQIEIPIMVPMLEGKGGGA